MWRRRIRDRERERERERKGMRKRAIAGKSELLARKLEAKLEGLSCRTVAGRVR